MLIKVVDYQWEHPALQRYVREMSAGQFLFRQGQPGKSMFIILRGVAALYARRQGKDYLMEVLEAGEFLGEKAVMSHKPHVRFFSAQARSDMKLLELELPDFEAIQRDLPVLVTDLLKGMFQIAAQRLDRANQVISAMRSSSNPERFVALVQLMAQQSSPTAYGPEFFLNTEKIRYYLDMSQVDVEKCLETLVRHGILLKSGDQSYLLRNPKALEGAAETLADDLPTLKAI